jgi:outer membrane protein assembly factor BamD
VIVRAPGGAGVYERGAERFEAGDYYEAIQHFQELIREFPGSEYVDDAIYFLGRSYLENDDHALATAEFDRLIADHPDSPHVPEAEFFTGESYYRQMRSPQYDPEMTEQALSSFRRYLRLYPEGSLAADARGRVERCREWLAEKNILAGRQYLKLGHPSSALLYFQRVIDDFGDSRRAGEAWLGIGRAREAGGDVAGARQAYETALAGETPAADEVRGEARERLERLGGP